MKDTVIIDGKEYETEYSIPSDDTVIWRFMDLAKFVSLLKDKALFMTRADRFEDQFEGAVCAEEDADRYNEALMVYYAEMLKGNAVPKELFDNERTANRLLRMNSYINCWYEGEHETMAMWRLYASGKEAKGVAVKTTVGQLKNAIGHYVEIGRIEYIDYSIQWPNVNAALWCKSVSFEYEHEVRVRITPEKGLSYTPAVFMTLPVDLNELIETIYVSPMAESWFKDVIVDLVEKYGVKKDVYHSRLDSKGLI